jgi:hypothetical protein
MILLCLLFVVLLPGLVGAQGLTDAQYQVLHDDILITHQAEFAQWVADGEYQKITDAYNVQATPVYWVWRTSLTPKEIYEATADGGGTWSWVTYKAQTQQERDSWRDMMGPTQLNPSLKQTRDGWLAIFGGQGASQIQVNFLLALSRRQALRGEVLFTVASPGGAGTRGSTANPDTMTYQGQITYADVNHAISGAPLPGRP